MHALPDALAMVVAELPPAQLFGLTDYEIALVILTAQALIFEDLEAYRTRDPAAHNDEFMIDGVCNGFAAVVFYRVASEFYRMSLEHEAAGEKEAARALRRLARYISQRGLLKTGVDIHPAAVIGRRFVIDHGSGTVIGETAIIGDDCYLLNNVLLGAAGIGDNAEGRRHPKLGNRVTIGERGGESAVFVCEPVPVEDFVKIGDRVQIGGHVRILGPVVIGDDVFIGVGCLIIANIESGMRVTRTNELQMTKAPRTNTPDLPAKPNSPQVDGVHGLPDATVARVFGTNFYAHTKVRLADKLGKSLNACIKYTTTRVTATEIDVLIEEVDPDLDLNSVCLWVEPAEQDAIAIMGSRGLKRVLEAVRRGGMQ